jgi:hypothetical protein
VKPTRVLLSNGDIVYCASLPYRGIRRLIEVARRRDETKVRLNGRTVKVGLIAHVEPPQEPAR